MFQRLAPRLFSERLLQYGILATIGAVIAVAIALALQTGAEVQPAQVLGAGSCSTDSWPYADGNCGEDVASNKRSVRLVSPDRIEKKSVYTAPASVPARPESEPVETAASPPPASPGGDSVAAPPAEEHATPAVAPNDTKVRSVSPKARAQQRPRYRSVERHRPLGLGLAPREKSFTGAGRGFDAVH